MTEPAKSQSDATGDSVESFRLTRVWLIVGLLAIAVGIACGLVMSTATFIR